VTTLAGPGALGAPAPRPERDVLTLLERCELELLGLLPRSSNYTFLARAAEAPDVLVVYKPRAGEAPLLDFPEGTLCQREVAAYVVSKAIGWPNVPPTVLRDGPEGIGSAQLFVPFETDQHYFTLAESRLDDFRAVAAFDAVVNNADRKAGHCLVSEAGELFVVDHGVCFHRAAKLRTVIWEFAGQPLDAPVVEGLRRLVAALRGPDLPDSLAPLLSAAEIAAIEARAEELLGDGSYPSPGPGRPYPWPVV
jgi:uncharacterized repeat protein (TIGR03843 family)